MKNIFTSQNYSRVVPLWVRLAFLMVKLSNVILLIVGFRLVV